MWVGSDRQGRWICERHWHETRHIVKGHVLSKCSCDPSKPWMTPAIEKPVSLPPTTVIVADGHIVGHCDTWELTQEFHQPLYSAGQMTPIETPDPCFYTLKLRGFVPTWKQRA